MADTTEPAQNTIRYKYVIIDRDVYTIVDVPFYYTEDGGYTWQVQINAVPVLCEDLTWKNVNA